MTPARLLAGGLIVALLAADPVLAQRVALVVGNGQYRHVASLPNPTNDALGVSRKLEELGFEVITTFDADLEDMRRSLDLFGEQAQGAEIALVFYAGHGIQVGGENYLLPVDARIASQGDLASGAVPASDLFEEFISASPELAILILDACRDNPFVTAVSAELGLASGSASAGAVLQRPNAAGVLIAFSAAPGAVAADGADGNSPYTTALLMWLDRPGLEIGTMFRRVRGTVLDLTGGVQVPWVEEALLREVYLNGDGPADRRLDLIGDPIEVALLDTIEGIDQPAERAAAEEFFDRYTGRSQQSGSAGSDRLTAAEEDMVHGGLVWLSIRESTDPDVFEAFLQHFPDSLFATLARQRIEDLETVPEVAVASVELGAPTALLTAEVDLPASDALREEAPTPGQLGLPPSSDVAPSDVAVSAPAPGEAEDALGLDEAGLAGVQLLLAHGGDYAGDADAIFGPGTRRAVESFQRAAGLPADGYLDAPTLRHLVERSAGAVLRGELSPDLRNGIHRVAAAATGLAEPEVIRVAAIVRNDDVHALWRSEADEFEADHPGTRIEIRHLPGSEYKAELLNMLGSETPPDILHTWGGGHLEALADAGFLRSLTPEMSEGWAMEFKPGALQNYTLDGHIYAAPVHMALVGLWANEAVLDRAGIPVERLETWEGFLASVEGLKAQGITPIAIGGGDVWPFQLLWGSLAQQIGGREAIEQAIAGEGEGFLDPAFVEAGDGLRQLADLAPFQEGFLEMNDGEAAEVFARGEAAMIVTGNWRLARMRWSWPGGSDRMIEEIEHLSIPAPGTDSDARITYGGVDGFAVTQEAPDAAVDFLHRLVGREMQDSMSAFTTDVPSISGADLAIEDPLLSEMASILLGSTYHQLYLDQALGPNAGEVVNEAALALGTGQMTGPQAADAVDRAWDQALLEEGDGQAPMAAE